MYNWHTFFSPICQIHLQSCILAGGVAIGVSMPVVHQPWEAMTIGFTAAVVSTIGFRYLKVCIAICLWIKLTLHPDI